MLIEDEENEVNLKKQVPNNVLFVSLDSDIMLFRFNKPQ